MLSPYSYRSALLDLLTSSAAEPQGVEDDGVGIQAPHVHADPAPTPHPYIPSLRLNRRSAPSVAGREKQEASNTRSKTFALTAAAVPSDSPSLPVAPASETPCASANRCVIEDSVLGQGNLLARVHAVPKYAPPTAHQGSTPLRVSHVAVSEEENRSVILSFIDKCICAGVPEAVIAEQVQFMASSIKESLALHAALHAQKHQDRIREYELNELTAMLERQQLQFAQVQCQQAASSLPASAPALSSSSPTPARPAPSLSYAPLQQQEPPVCSTDEWMIDAKPFHYKSISQRLLNDTRLTYPSTDIAQEHFDHDGRTSLLPRRTTNQGPLNVNGSTGAPQPVPLFSWRARAPSYASASETPPAPAAWSDKSSCSGAAGVGSSTGHARVQPRSQSPRSRTTTAPRELPHTNETWCHNHRRHRSHHMLCSACYPSSSAEQLSSTCTAQAAPVNSHPIDGEHPGQQRGPMANYRQQYKSSLHYMKPTHASMARRETKSQSSSPLRNTSPEAARSPRDERHAKLAPLQRRGSAKCPLATRRDAPPLAAHPAAPQKLIARATHSSSLRVATALQKQSASVKDRDDSRKDELHGFHMGSNAVAVSQFERRESAPHQSDWSTPEPQRSVAPSAAVVTDESLRATPVQMPTSRMRASPWSGAPEPSLSPNGWSADTYPTKPRFSVDPEQPLYATNTSARSGRDRKVKMTTRSAAVMSTAATRRDSEKPLHSSWAAGSASPSTPEVFTSTSSLQRLAPSHSAQETAKGGQSPHPQQQQQQQRQSQVRRPRRPPPLSQASSSYPGAFTAALGAAASAAAVLDDDYSDTNVCLTSPELQLFMERSQRKLRETDRVLAQAPTPPRIASVSHSRPSPSPISIFNTSHSPTLNSTATSSFVPPSSGDAQRARSLSKGLSGLSRDAVQARRQQRLAELRWRLSNYETNSNTSNSTGARPVGTAPLTPPSSAVVIDMPPELQECTSDVFQPHVALSVPLENSPLIQISPTSSDEDQSDYDQTRVTV
ncbi:hypothetical protein JKF63_05574 [Porcisia hertigi]|uniref:Uncharacterized protein n=1 Tax=Porcisia hertigi TaxID=2761500 RepID=A0A836LCT4_9TRYP|nr:hypothetical protein JKF63_05574 [Porcisia hertigi]